MMNEWNIQEWNAQWMKCSINEMIKWMKWSMNEMINEWNDQWMKWSMNEMPMKWIKWSNEWYV